MLVRIDTYRHANDSLHSIVYEQKNQIKDCKIAITFCEEEKESKIRENNINLQLGIKCADEVKKQRKLVKFWKHLTGVVGVFAFGGFLFMASR